MFSFCKWILILWCERLFHPEHELTVLVCDWRHPLKGRSATRRGPLLIVNWLQSHSPEIPKNVDGFQLLEAIRWHFSVCRSVDAWLQPTGIFGPSCIAPSHLEHACRVPRGTWPHAVYVIKLISKLWPSTPHLYIAGPVCYPVCICHFKIEVSIVVSRCRVHRSDCLFIEDMQSWQTTFPLVPLLKHMTWNGP